MFERRRDGSDVMTRDAKFLLHEIQLWMGFFQCNDGKVFDRARDYKILGGVVDWVGDRRLD